MSGTNHFTPTVYDTIRDGAARSAAIVAPIVLACVGRPGERIRTVIDVGCGEGHWAKAFADLGRDVLGVDGPHVDHILGDQFRAADLSRPLPNFGRFDLVVCLEVGEHLSVRRAPGLVADLCALGDVVLFSAAIPHQTGPGHINCQWPSWWAGLFATHGYSLSGNLRWTIWDDARIEPWYRQNLLIARLAQEDEWVGPSPGLDVVHPDIHEWGR